MSSTTKVKGRQNTSNRVKSINSVVKVMKPEEYITNEQYAQRKKTEYKHKKLRQQVKNNEKSQRGFGYNYKPVQFDYSEDN